MVHKRHGQCIFSCDNKKCINESTETFKDIICPYHLSQVFGLKVAIEKFEKESTDFYVGPFLILDDSFSFEPNTVVFPERDFIDQHIGMKAATSPDFYQYKMNPRMRSYLDNLLTNTFNLPLNEARYQTEIIRNLFFNVPAKQLAEGTNDAGAVGVSIADSDKINLAKGTESSHKSLQIELDTRFQQLNSTILTEDYNAIFNEIEILSSTSDTTHPLNSFTPFMRFMIFNCLTDEHKLPVTVNTAVGITCYLNLLYMPGIGFVTTQEILHPSHLAIGGVTKGNNSFYQLKVRPIPKRTVQNSSMYKRNLADNVRSSNVLNLQHEYCWTRR